MTSYFGHVRQRARILDVDGTLCDVTSVRHHVVCPRELKDFDAFHSGSRACPPNQMAIDYAVETVALGMVPVVVTARMERWANLTRDWLAEHMPVEFDGPFHRRDGDMRSDRIVKLEILRYLRRHYDIRGAIDDNPDVIALWQSQGIPVTVVPGWDVSEVASR